jgi:hypothetical protein
MSDTLTVRYWKTVRSEPAVQITYEEWLAHLEAAGRPLANAGGFSYLDISCHSEIVVPEIEPHEYEESLDWFLDMHSLCAFCTQPEDAPVHQEHGNG